MGFLRRDPASKLKKVFRDYELPSFPGVVTALMAAVRNPQSSNEEVAGVLAADPGLSVKVLALANSAAFSPVRKVESLAQAVALVGMRQLELIAINVGVQSRMPAHPAPGYEPAAFWRLAALRAALAFEFARVLTPTQEAVAFTAAYLQDLAVPLLLTQRAREYAPVWLAHAGDGETLVAQERRRFGWDHAAVARWICEHWKLPEHIANEIEGHHGSRSDEQQPASPPVRLAARLSSCEIEKQREALVEAAREECGLGEDVTLELLDRAAERSEELARLLG